MSRVSEETCQSTQTASFLAVSHSIQKKEAC